MLLYRLQWFWMQFYGENSRWGRERKTDKMRLPERDAVLDIWKTDSAVVCGK